MTSIPAYHPELAATTPRVLLVDDDPIFRQLAANKLAVHRCDVVEAEDGTDAWSAIISGRFTIALVDLDMPNMGGTDLIRCIRGFPRTANLPVIVMTARDPHEAVRECLEIGATAFLSKPVNWGLFSKYIEHTLALGSAAETGVRLEADARRTADQLATVRTDLIAEIERYVASIARIAGPALAGSEAEAAPRQALEAVVEESLRAEAALLRLASGLGGKLEPLAATGPGRPAVRRVSSTQS